MSETKLISRREFIQILATAAAAYPLSSLAANRKNIPVAVEHKEPWLTLSVVQQHLFPAEKNSPHSIGANDINALNYLRNMMATPGFDKEDAELVHNGVKWLNDLSKQQHSKKFNQLDTKSKEKILRRIEGSNAGSRWLSLLLTYLLEALLSDPVYGGNPNGIGWEWLQHQPGFPRPAADKKYFKLSSRKQSANRNRITKA